MLTQAQAREYNRFKKLGSFFVAETNVYSSFIPFATEVTSFNANFQNFEELIPGKTETATGITTDKTTLKRKVATHLALVCRKTRSYALRFNQTNLLVEANQNMRRKTSHNTIKAAFNLRYRNSQTQFEVSRREMFNRLSDARKAARYLEGKVTFNRSELETINATIEEMYLELCKRADFNDG